MGSKWDAAAAMAVNAMGDRGVKRRDAARGYLAHITSDGLDAAAVVAAIAEHSQLTDKGVAHEDHAHAATVYALSIHDVRVLAGFCAAVHRIGGWDVADVTADALEDGYPIVGAIVGRLLHKSPMGPTDSATMDRLVQTLTNDERMTLVCNTSAMLGALGFTQAEIRSLLGDQGDQGDQGDAGTMAEAVAQAWHSGDGDACGGQMPETD